MPDQPSGFTVTDRRKFTIEGDLREGAAPAEETQQSEPKPDPRSDQKLGPQLVQNAPAPEKEVVKEVVNPNLEPLPARRKPPTSFPRRPPSSPRSRTPTTVPLPKNSTT